MRYFKGWGTFTAGARQTVGGITPGVLLELTAWGHSWHCEDWNACHEYPESGPPNVWSYPPGASVFMRIGIDPTGGTDPFSGNVVWSNGINALDSYRQFSVQARAQSDRVTVFLWASQNTPTENQDAYWDDARLAVVGPGGGSAPGGGGQQVAQQVTPVTEVLADGTTVHVVQSGDTLSAIAVAYNMSLEELRALNGLGPNESMIFSGQRLIVRAIQATRVVASPETPEPTPTEAPAETPAAVSQVQTPTGGNGWLAYLGWGEDDTDWEIYLLDLGNQGAQRCA
ncbi:MAG: LysM peptidoglycan-binding domain-containing protein [Anaerolineae bacterium]|nr:LysM peptidoglycan-binding domain-containing protein [Anaerolineae bacterium]